MATKIERNKFKKVYFRISAGYEWGVGWTKSDAPFKEETRALFRNAGWDVIANDAKNGISDEARKDGQYLYLHPMDFSGYMKPENIHELEELLKTAETFSLYAVDTYDDVYEVQDDADEMKLYHEVWDDRIEEILQGMLTTKRRNLYKNIGAVHYNLWSSGKIFLHTTLHDCGVCSSGDVGDRYIHDKIDEFIKKGLIIEAHDKASLCRWRSPKDNIH